MLSGATSRATNEEDISMRNDRKKLIAVFIFTLAGLIACEHRNEEATRPAEGTAPPSTGATPARAEVAPKQANDWIVLENTTYLPVLDDFGKSLLDARANFVKKDNKAASSDLRESAEMLKKEAPAAAGSNQAAITAASSELNRLADSIDKGEVRSVKQVDAVINNAYKADAERDWLVIDEWAAYPDEPDQHFHRAYDNFAKKDYHAAAAEIRKGAAFIGLEAGRATADGKAALQSSAQELSQLADSVEKGAVKNANELNPHFARANQALAQAHYRNASESWARKAADATGYELKAAASDVEKAAAWAGQKVETGASDVINGVRLVAGKLITGAGYGADEVGSGIEALGREIERLGTKIRPR